MSRDELVEDGWFLAYGDYSKRRVYEVFTKDGEKRCFLNNVEIECF